MTTTRAWAGLAAAVCCAAMIGSRAFSIQLTSPTTQERTERESVTFSHGLPRLDGGHLKVTLVDVTYGPGESSPIHAHRCPVIGYVVEGALRTQVKGEAEAIYKAGESFYEAPNGVHVISANASREERTRFIAYFVCDHDTPLSVDVPGNKSSGGK